MAASHCAPWREALNSAGPNERGFLVLLEHSDCTQPFSEKGCMTPADPVESNSVPKLLEPLREDSRLRLFTSSCCIRARDKVQNKNYTPATFCYKNPARRCSFHSSPMLYFALQLTQPDTWPGWAPTTKQMPPEIVEKILNNIPRPGLPEIFNFMKQPMKASLQCCRQVFQSPSPHSRILFGHGFFLQVLI